MSFYSPQSSGKSNYVQRKESGRTRSSTLPSDDLERTKASNRQRPVSGDLRRQALERGRQRKISEPCKRVSSSGPPAGQPVNNVPAGDEPRQRASTLSPSTIRKLPSRQRKISQHRSIQQDHYHSSDSLIPHSQSKAGGSPTQSAVTSVGEMLDNTLKLFSDESLSVCREPLPKGSFHHEMVIQQLTVAPDEQTLQHHRRKGVVNPPERGFEASTVDDPLSSRPGNNHVHFK